MIAEIQDIEWDRQLIKFEKMILQGITSNTELSNAFGISVECVSKWRNEVRRRRLGSHQELEDNRQERIAALNLIKHKAMTAYDRSCQDAEEYFTTYKDCSVCKGSGKAKEDKDCDKCQGYGTVEVTNHKITGQAGDVSYLQLAKEIEIEIAKLQGLHPLGNRGMHLQRTAVRIGGEIEEEVMSLFVETDDQQVMALSQALVLIDEALDRKSNKGDVIDVG